MVIEIGQVVQDFAIIMILASVMALISYDIMRYHIKDLSFILTWVVKFLGSLPRVAKLVALLTPVTGYYGGILAKYPIRENTSNLKTHHTYIRALCSW